jgi:hypothetical protein
MAAEVSSALAAKWAATGDAAYRSQAEEMLGKAQSLAVSDTDKTEYREYSERIRYRIESREIIDKPEYDRRFRAANNVPKKVSQ